MITTTSNENIEYVFVIKKSPNGKGCLYITNLRICFESETHGIIFSFPFDVISRYDSPKHDKFRIDWVQGDSKLYYEMYVKSGTEVFNCYKMANQKFAESNLGTQS